MTVSVELTVAKHSVSETKPELAETVVPINGPKSSNPAWCYYQKKPGEHLRAATTTSPTTCTSPGRVMHGGSGTRGGVVGYGYTGVQGTGTPLPGTPLPVPLTGTPLQLPQPGTQLPGHHSQTPLPGHHSQAPLPGHLSETPLPVPLARTPLPVLPLIIHGSAEH